MGNQNSLKTTLIVRYLDVILVAAGQASIILPIQFEGLAWYFILAGIALGAAGLGLRAKKTGRSVASWVLVGIFFPLLVPVIGLIVMLVKGARQPQAASADPKPAKMYVHGCMGFAVFLVGAIVMDSLSFALLCVFIAIIWVALHRKGGYTRKAKLAVIGIYVLALLMVFAVKSINDRVSHANAKVIIAACEKCREKTGRYPDGLNDLVPGYLPRVPVARYTFISSGFYYHRDRGASANNFRLIFVNEAPFARMVYDSTHKQWRSID